MGRFLAQLGIPTIAISLVLIATPVFGQHGPSADQQYQAAQSRCQGAVNQMVAAQRAGGAQSQEFLFGEPMRSVAGQSTESINRLLASTQEDIATFGNFPVFRLMYEAQICFLQTFLEVRRSAPSAPPPTAPPAAPAPRQNLADPVRTNPSPVQASGSGQGLDPAISQAMAEAEDSGLEALRMIREGLAGLADGNPGGEASSEPSPLGLRGQTPNVRPRATSYGPAPVLVREQYSIRGAPVDCIRIGLDTPQVDSDDDWVTQARLENNCGQDMLIRLDIWEELVGQLGGTARYTADGSPWRHEGARYPDYTYFPPLSVIGFTPICYAEPGAASCAPPFVGFVRDGWRSANLYQADARPEAMPVRLHYWLIACPAIDPASGRQNGMFLTAAFLRDAPRWTCVPVPDPQPPAIDLEGRPIPTTGRFEGGQPIQSTGRFEGEGRPIPTTGRFEGGQPIQSTGRFEGEGRPIPTTGRFETEGRIIPGTERGAGEGAPSGSTDNDTTSDGEASSPASGGRPSVPFPY